MTLLPTETHNFFTVLIFTTGMLAGLISTTEESL